MYCISQDLFMLSQAFIEFKVVWEIGGLALDPNWKILYSIFKIVFMLLCNKIFSSYLQKILKYSKRHSFTGYSFQRSKTSVFVAQHSNFLVKKMQHVIFITYSFINFLTTDRILRLDIFHFNFNLYGRMEITFLTFFFLNAHPFFWL